MLNRRSFVLAMAGASIAFPHIVRAQSYPSRPVKMVVGFSPGGGTDVTARIIADKISALLGQAVVVENKPGAAGTLAAGQVERENPDGYTILLNASGAFIHSILRSKYNYDPMEVCTPISPATITPVVMLVNPSLPVNSVQEFVELAKKEKNGLSFGSDGVAGTTQLVGEYFSELAGIELLHVPFKGAGESVVATVSGQVDANFPTLPSAMSMLRAGRVKPLAVSGTVRSKQLPDVPTFEELGYKDIDFLCWFGLVGPKGMPPEVVQVLNDATQEALKDDKIRTAIEAQGMEVMKGNPQEWLDFMVRDAKNIERMARFSDLQIA